MGEREVAIDPTKLHVCKIWEATSHSGLLNRLSPNRLCAIATSVFLRFASSARAHWFV
jgi:hypothetical protein